MVNINLKIEPNCKRILEIEVPQDQVSSELEEHFSLFRSRAKIPGFRPGKAPMDMVRRKYAETIRGEVLDELIGKAVEEALKQENLLPIIRPKISRIDYDDGKPLKFRAEIEIRPEIKLEGYKGFEIKKTVQKVSDNDVETYLKSLHNRTAEYIPVDRKCHDDDLLIVDLVRKTDLPDNPGEQKAENVEIELGSETVLKEFKEGLRGTGIGDIKEIEVVYPGDYEQKDLAGYKIKYLVIVKEVKEKKLPPLDDEFAKRFGDTPDLGSLRKNLKERLVIKASNDADAKVRSEIVKKVVEANRFEVPESMIESQLRAVSEDFKKRYKDVDELELRQTYRPIGENNLRWQFLYYEIASAEGIQVTEEDRANWVKEFARAYKVSEEEARQSLGRARKMDDIEDSIIEKKVLDFISQNIKIVG